MREVYCKANLIQARYYPNKQSKHKKVRLTFRLSGLNFQLNLLIEARADLLIVVYSLDNLCEDISN